MIPIYEQGKGKGIGHSLDSFMTTFSEKVNHNQSGKCFAFIFYDFSDSTFHKQLKDISFFAKLDRIAGPELDIFYLHSGGIKAIQTFNKFGKDVLGLSNALKMPCIILFRTKEENIVDMEIIEMSNKLSIIDIEDICSTLNEYIERKQHKTGKNIVKVAKYFGNQLFSAALGAALGLIIR